MHGSCFYLPGFYKNKCSGTSGPGGDPLDAVDSVAQTSIIKSLNTNLKEARNVSSSKSYLAQPGKTLPNATTDNHENKQEQTLKSPAATTLAGYYR